MSFIINDIYVLCNKSFPAPKLWRYDFLDIFSSRNLALDFSSMIHYELIFLYGVRYELRLIFSIQISIYSNSVLKYFHIFLSPLNCIRILIENQLWPIDSLLDYPKKFFFWLCHVACGILVPDQRSSPHPLQWKPVLTTGCGKGSPWTIQIWYPYDAVLIAASLF